MADIPNELKYTKDHEWLRAKEDGTAEVGITDYAQESLGDITFVELPAEGDAFSAGEVFGVVESVKAASDLFLPVAGEILAVNEELDSAPDLVNSDPYGKGWIIRIRVEDPSEVDGLADAGAYGEMI